MNANRVNIKRPRSPGQRLDLHAPPGAAGRRFCVAAGLLAGAVLVLAFAVRPVFGEEATPGRLVFEQIPAGRAATQTGSGSRIVLRDQGASEPGVIVLTPDFVAAGRPDVSFDGKRIVFVGKRRLEDPLSIWEMGVDDRAARPIVRFSTDCTEVRYLSTIYSLEAERPEYQLCFCRADEFGVGAAYTCRMDGSQVRRISFDPHGAFDLTPLSDSRLLMMSPRFDAPAGASGGLSAGKTALVTANTDGTDVRAFAAPSSPAVRRTPCELRDGRVVFAESSAGGGGSGAALVAVSRTRGLYSHEVLSADPDGRYFSPSALPNGRLLVSYRPKGAESFGVYSIEASRGSPRRVARGGARPALVYDSPRWHEVWPAALGPRPEPAGRSSQVDDRVDYGYLYALDSYLSDTPEGERIQAGDIKQVEVFKAIARRRGSGAVKEQSLGKAPVEADGSLFITVPARTPLRLQTLDAGGKVLQSMRSWMWVMPKEGRGCIGCHEDRALAPPNRHVLALRRPPNAVGVAPERRDEVLAGPSSEIRDDSDAGRSDGEDR